MKIFVIILNFNGWENTLECLYSGRKLNLPRGATVEQVVVDNASGDDSVKRIKKEFPKLIMIQNQTNLGFTGGTNEGIRYALKSGADFVMLLNNDTIMHPDLIRSLLEPFERDIVGAVVPKIYFEKGYEFHKGRYKETDMGKVIWYAGGNMDWKNLIGQNIGVDEVDHGQYDIRTETDIATGCCFMIRASLLSKIGLFDSRYFLYYEDADLSMRIRKTGYEIIYEPNAVVWHKNAESSGTGSDLHDYYISRNRLLFGMRYAPTRTKLALLRESLSLIRTGRKWQKRGVWDFYIRKFGRGTFPI
jgi:GT2 family glycosyltransferase